MKLGDTINGYRVTTRPGNDDAGKSVWAFANKDGTPYFLKQFLEPKRPRTGSKASARSRELRLQECREFEQRHHRVGELLRSRHGEPGTGNLVIPIDFFAAGSTYYKVTERIEVADRGAESFTPQEKLVLLRTLGLSLRLLHGIGVVHGDLKPTNVLIQRKPATAAFYPAKLIDFDDSYVSGEPPAPGLLGGDLLFGAPEWLRYMREDSSVRARELTERADMFGLGLLAHYYLTLELPAHDRAFGSPAEAVDAGAPLEFDARLSAPMRELLAALTSAEPMTRPDIGEFIDAVRDPALCELSAPRPVTGVPRLRIASFDKTVSPAKPAAPRKPKAPAPPSSSGTRSRLRINLGDDGRS